MKKNFYHFLLYLKKQWPAYVQEDELYHFTGGVGKPLDELAEHGFLLRTEVKAKDGKKNEILPHYTLGPNGFLYLQSVRMNRWLLMVGTATIIAAIMACISVWYRFALI